MADTIRDIVLVLVPMVLSLSVHEAAHAAAAYWLGDDTAKQMGRLTLNPAAHVDPIGTLALPIMIVVFQGAGLGVPFFGWAKPVPFNPARFRRSVTLRTGTMIVAAAGPISNIILAVLSAAGLSLILHLQLDVSEAVSQLFLKMLLVNISLALFNMIPVHPLDGEKVLAGLLPPAASISFERFNARYGSMLLIGVIMLGGKLISVPFVLLFTALVTVFGLYG